ncbi:GtrA family protein [uncultured Bacteroides sp.]|uniref:GtrA family protein n=1 Tax=uncultured Bacteroides sp. TaxID=162156 RepID=UPI00260A5307|nr:GtrA family protein [uncultured Bacteroides sp.]
MKKREVTGEIIRFGIVGVLATAAHYGIYYLLKNYMNVNIAYTIGYVLSFIMNFYLTAFFTFHASPSWKKMIGMGGAHAVNYALHIILLNFFLFVGVPDTWAPFPVFAIAIPVNFILVRFVFKHRKL